MNFNNYLKRVNLTSILFFLKEGSEYFGPTSQKTYSQRIKDAERNAINFFKMRYKNVAEFDEITGYFYDQTSVYEEVFFEIGMILGAKLAFQISEKVKELE